MLHLDLGLQQPELHHRAGFTIKGFHSCPTIHSQPILRQHAAAMSELPAVPAPGSGLLRKPAVLLIVVTAWQRNQRPLHALEWRGLSELVQWVRRLPQLHGEHAVFDGETEVA